jgi:acyl-CoA dehydrogenase
VDFAAPAEIRELRDRVRAFVDAEVIPVEHGMAAAFEAEVGPGVPFPAAMRRLRERARERGLWNLSLPADQGGEGLPHHHYAVLCEEMGRSLAAPRAFNCEAPDSGNADILRAYGTPDQRERYLAQLLDGTIRSCFSMTEPEVAGSDPTAMRTRARVDGDRVVITGHKWFTTGAVGASFAIVAAVTDPDAQPHRRSSLFVVPMDAPGIEIVRSLSVMGHAAMAGHAELRYRDVEVGADAMLGERGAGFSIAQARLGPGRLHHCMRAIGSAERALELLCRRARTREVRGTPLADRQLIQDLVARSRVEIDQARLVTLYAAWRMDLVGSDAAADVSVAKVAAPSMAQRVIDRAIQVLGALGVTQDTPLAALATHARTVRLVDGTDEVHKLVVARRELAPRALRSPARA